MRTVTFKYKESINETALSVKQKGPIFTSFFFQCYLNKAQV